MKKTHIIGIVLAVLVLAAGAVGFWFTGNSVEAAEAAHRSVFDTYSSLKTNAAHTALTVHEDGIVIGSYTMEELGLLPQLEEAVDQQFSDVDRMPPLTFSELTAKEKLQWNREPHPKKPSVAPALNVLDLQPVFRDLEAQSRQPAENAYVDFVDGSFLVHPEVPGTQLQTEPVSEGLTQAVGSLVITPQSTAEVRFELTDVDCYLPPEITVENTFFDFPAMLRDSIQDMTVTLNFHGKPEVLKADQLADILYTDAKGKVQVDNDVLKPIIQGWWESHQESDVPYLFDSYVDGIIPLDFLHVDYEINQEALLADLTEQLVLLESFDLVPEWYCWRNAEPFSIEGEYIEIDINNQTMTYFKDDEVVVTTPVVTGATWGYPTPEGLYDIDNKDTDCWLKGDDYNVHVDYWMGFVGVYIGIHDADWRTKFGGENYIKNGSHGCVNTPKEATKIIFDNAEVGVPVLVHGK